MKRERVALDTNVLISGLLSTTSTPARAVEHVIRKGQIIASAATLRELMTTLLSPKWRADKKGPRRAAGSPEPHRRTSPKAQGLSPKAYGRQKLNFAMNRMVRLPCRPFSTL